MSQDSKLKSLAEIARLLLDRDLAALAKAAADKAESEARLADLARPMTAELPVVAAQLAELRWQTWADARRAEINLTLARQTATWLEAREAAQRAFARDAALAALRRKYAQLS